MKFNDAEFKRITRIKKKLHRLILAEFKINDPQDGDVTLYYKKITDNICEHFDINEK